MNGSVYVQNKQDTVVSPLFDTYAVAAAAAVSAEYDMFGQIRGSSSIGPNTTNMTKAFELPSIEKFVVKSMRAVFVGCALADLISFSKNYVMRLIVGGKTYLEAPAEYFAGGAGVTGYAAIPDAGTATSNYSNGVPDPRAIMTTTGYEIPISGGTPFRVKLLGTSFNASAAFVLRVYLDGLYTRGVQ